MNEYCEQWTCNGHLPWVPLVHGFCFAIKRKVIDKIGYFDDVSFPRGYGEENDYCFRATDAGFILALATHTYIYHAKSKSYTDEERLKLMKEAAQNFENKHGSSRIKRASKTMNINPILMEFRNRAKLLAEHFLSQKDINNLYHKSNSITLFEKIEQSFNKKNTLLDTIELAKILLITDMHGDDTRNKLFL